MVGLVVLVLFIVVALAAPLLFPQTLLDVTQATGQPFEPPSLEYPLGTDDSGRSVLALVVLGRPDLAAGRLRRDRALDVHRHDRRDHVRALPRSHRRRRSTGSPTGSW